MTGFKSICGVRSQIIMMNTFCINVTFSLSLVSIEHINMCIWNSLSLIVSFLFPLSLSTTQPSSVCLSFSCLHHNQLFIPLTFSLHYPIIPLYRSIQAFPASFIFPFSFNSPLDVNHLLWLSFSISPSSFILFIYLFFVLHHCSILPSIRLYTAAGNRQEEGSGDTCEIEKDGRGEISVTMR